jgi:cytoskeletal protein RodZ
MNQWRVVLTVVIVALGSGALWVWHEGSQNTDATPVPAEASAPVQQSPAPVPDQSVASDATPAPQSSPPAQPASVAAEDDKSTTSAAVEPPNVDTPEPAERKFASGGRSESDQN